MDFLACDLMFDSVVSYFFFQNFEIHLRTRISEYFFFFVDKASVPASARNLFKIILDASVCAGEAVSL